MKTIIPILIVLMLFSSCKKEKDPVASFEINGTTKVGQSLSFVNNSTNASLYEWNFGDGEITTINVPTHTYKKPGNYTITLMAKSDNGTSSTNKSIKITGITYSFKNNSSLDIPSFYSYYYDGTDVLDLTMHGVFNKGTETEPVITTRNLIMAGFTINGVVTIIVDTYVLVPDQHNTFTITDNTHIYSGKGETDSKIFEAVRKALQ